MSKSNIEWTDETWNVTTGCTRVSMGCDNCYAVAMTRRLGNHPNEKIQEKYSGLVNEGKGHFNGRIKLHEDELEKPLHWRKPRMVFVNSMSDLFHPKVPFEFIDKVFAVMARAEKHIFQILTKRPDRMSLYLDSYQVDYHSDHDFGMMFRPDIPERGQGGSENLLCGDFEWPLKNVWLGTSVEKQEAANERIPHLLNCPATVRFLSCEPLLGGVDLRMDDCWIPPDHYSLGERLDWVIVGGESGPNARPMHPEWVRSLRDQCNEAGVAYFFKQWGAFQEGSDYGNVNTKNHVVLKNGDHAHFFDDDGFKDLKNRYRGTRWGRMNPVIMAKVGKKKAGRLLDGREWNEMPEVL